MCAACIAHGITHVAGNHLEHTSTGSTPRATPAPTRSPNRAPNRCRPRYAPAERQEASPKCRSGTAHRARSAISRTLQIRGKRQNVSTDHLRQNVEPSHRGESARSARLRRWTPHRERSDRPDGGSGQAPRSVTLSTEGCFSARLVLGGRYPRDWRLQRPPIRPGRPPARPQHVAALLPVGVRHGRAAVVLVPLRPSG